MLDPISTGAPRSDAEDLARLGYRQELRRDLGSLSAFAAGFSYVSILTTVFQLFVIGYAFGGTPSRSTSPRWARTTPWRAPCTSGGAASRPASPGGSRAG